MATGPIETATAPLLVLGERLYSQLVAALPQSAVYLFDRDLRFVLADGEAMRQVNLDPSQIVGRQLHEVVTADSLAVLEPAYRAALQGEDVDLTLPSARSGVERWYRVRLRPVTADDGQVIGGLVVTDDISDDRAAERALGESVAFQRGVLSVIPDPVLVVDARKGSHVWTSQEIGRSLGYTDGELARMSADRRELVHPDDLHLLEDALRRTHDLQDGEVLAVRHRALAADGGVRWFDRRKTPFRRSETGELLEYLSVVREVTAEVAAERERAEDLAFREAVLSASPDVISVLDLEEHQTVWASRDLQELLGYDLAHLQQEQQAGRIDWIHPDDAPAYLRSTTACDLADGEVTAQRVRVRHADGHWLAYERRLTPFRRHGDGSVSQVLVVTRDVTAQVEAETGLARARDFERAVIRATPDLVLLLDGVTSEVRWASRDLVEVLGWTGDELAVLGPCPFERLLLAQDAPELAARRDEALEAADGEVVHARFRVRHRDGGTRWLSQRMTPFRRDPDGAVAELLATVRDVTEVVEAQAAMEHAALHDGLTGLPNRRLVLDRLQMAVDGVRRGGEVAVLYLDLDGFKRVNDLHGHAAGDAVLLEVATRLQAALRPGDSVARLGGDEFVVLLPELGSAAREVAPQVSERIRETLKEEISHEGVVHRVGASIGLVYGGSGSRPEDLLRDADMAMYRAKAGGKDRTCVFDPEQRAEACHAAELEQQLRRALDDDQVEVHFQPLVSTREGTVIGAEALLRVPDGAGGHLPAGPLVAVAEETGLVRVLGDRVLRLACAAAAAWADPLPVSVNVSARELSLPAFADRVLEVLRTTGLPPSRLVIELTETALLEAARSTVVDLERLRREGVGIALDDFGTGYGSMRSLMDLPVSRLKVDRSFTAGMCTDAGSRALVRATINLALEMGMSCVVEGVETAEQLAAVGISEHLSVQGYLLGRPEAGTPRRAGAVPAPRLSEPDCPAGLAGSR